MHGLEYTLFTCPPAILAKSIRDTPVAKAWSDGVNRLPVESFFGWFKNELYIDYRPGSPEELREAVYVHALFHNNERPQSRLKNNAPIPYRKECA
ncbi:IS3 family transposase [Paenibacillus validus]|uniref:IS3 family transposase n=1 Tax=Paenibacillus validus TaxID=44253 RepID=A0A7X3CQA2_9BACL|nr:IS3 family transposase [Paenibacillus validus]